MIPTVDWSDDVLEEVALLGEGVGSAVHQVKDNAVDSSWSAIITTSEAPNCVVLRNCLSSSSAVHPNIVLFHGAYMSPSLQRHFKIPQGVLPHGTELQQSELQTVM